MSTDAVIEFLKQADADPDLQERLDRALADPDTPVASFLAAAAEHGHQFTAEEFLDAMQAQGVEPPSGELRDADLDAVAGGGGPTMMSRRTWGMTSRAMQLIGSYASGLGVRDLGRDAPMTGVEEEWTSA